MTMQRSPPNSSAMTKQSLDRSALNLEKNELMKSFGRPLREGQSMVRRSPGRCPAIGGNPGSYDGWVPHPAYAGVVG